MNRPFFPSATAVPFPARLGGGCANSPQYTWRLNECADCDTATGSRGCETCEGDGEVQASCVTCNRCVPLNSDGECVQCFDGGELTPDQWNEKHLTGWAKAEAAALNMGGKA